MTSRLPKATGFQVAFFIFAVVFLAAPIQKYLVPLVASGEGLERTLGRLSIFVPACLILMLVPAIRRFCVAELATPIGRSHRLEVALFVAFKTLVMPFAIVGAIVLWHWIVGGEMALARRIGNEDAAAASLARAMSMDGMILAIAIGALVAPVIEELVFRGLLFRAWEAQWGWFPAMVATSAVFAAYHPVPFSAFVASMLFVALYRRTGSLRGCILAHSAYNFLLWYPLLGQLIFRKAGKETGEIALWPFHLAALAALAIALPVYVWMARSPGAGRGNVVVHIAAVRC